MNQVCGRSAFRSEAISSASTRSLLAGRALLCSVPRWAASVLALALLVVAVLSPVHVSAQTVRGTVTQGSGTDPVGGAFVVLERRGGERAVAGLTTADGQFELRAPSGGDYVLRIEAPSFQTFRDNVSVDGNASRDVQLTPHTVDYSTISASAQCRVRPTPTSPEGILWSEVLKLSEAVEWSSELEDLTFESMVYDRYMATGAGVVDNEGHDWLVASVQVPFYTPDDVLTDGFMESGEEDDQVVYSYFGPGPSTFRSSEFSDRYCLAAVRDPNQVGAVAVAFRPAEPDPDRIDVEGEFWIDEETGKVRGLEYRYTGLPLLPVADTRFGGTIRYMQSPEGRWVQTHWELRMPWLSEDGGSVRGLHAQGGELRSTVRGEDELSRTPYVWPAAIVGAVYDSLSGGPLVRVPVRLAGTDYVTETDDDGRFALTQLPGSGEQYRLRYVHPRLGRRAYSSRDQAVTPRSGRLTEVNLTVPSAQAMFGQVCPATESTTMIAGSIIDSESGLPMSNALVFASWEGELGQTERIESRADEAGAYVVCGVPTDQSVALVADFLVNESLRTVLTPEEGEVEIWDFVVGPTQEVELSGNVTDAVTGEPVREAVVTLVGADRTMRSDSRGHFSFDGLDPGEYSIRVNHIAYGTEETGILLQPGARSIADVKLNVTSIDLPPLTVLVEAEGLDIGYFESDYVDRRDRMSRMGLGSFMGYDELKALNPSSIVDIIRAVVPIARVNSNGAIVLRTMSPGAAASQLTLLDAATETTTTVTVDQGRTCEDRGATVYIDNIPFRGGGENIDALVDINLIRAIEVYRRASEIPAEYLDSSSECGVVVLWTLRVAGNGRGGLH